MGRPRKKPAHELTTEEVLRKVFPKRVADKAKVEADKAAKKSSDTKDKP
jgi:hypothetical protein